MLINSTHSDDWWTLKNFSVSISHLVRQKNIRITNSNAGSSAEISRRRDVVPPLGPIDTRSLFFSRVLISPETWILIRAAWPCSWNSIRNYETVPEFRAAGNEGCRWMRGEGEDLLVLSARSQGIMVSSVRIMVARCAHDRVISWACRVGMFVSLFLFLLPSHAFHSLFSFPRLFFSLFFLR